LYVARPDADFHAGILQLSDDVIEVPGGHHDFDVTATATGTCPEIRLQRHKICSIRVDAQQWVNNKGASSGSADGCNYEIMQISNNV